MNPCSAAREIMSIDGQNMRKIPKLALLSCELPGASGRRQLDRERSKGVAKKN